MIDVEVKMELSMRTWNLIMMALSNKFYQTSITVMMKMLFKIGMVLSGLLILTACAVKLPTISRYTLNVPESLSSNPKSSQTKLSLLVNQPTAAPGYSTNRIIYTERPLQLQAYADGRWVAPPSQMLVQVMAEIIRSRGFFGTVLTPPFVGSSDFRLETRIIRLQQEYLLSSSQVHLTIWAGLVNQASSLVIATRTFDVSVPANQDVYSGVLAANHAASLISQQLAQFVVAKIKNLSS